MSAVERITNTRKYTQFKILKQHFFDLIIKTYDLLFKGEELNFDGIVFRFYELFLWFVSKEVYRLLGAVKKNGMLCIYVCLYWLENC